MAITSETLNLLNGVKIQISSVVDAQTRDLVRSWANSWDHLQVEWERALSDLARHGDTWPSATEIRRNRRTLNALSETQEQLEKLQASGVIRINMDAATAVTIGANGMISVLSSQLPTQTGLLTSFEQVSSRGMAAMARRTTQRVTSLAEGIGARSYGMMLTELLGGVSLGRNPFDVAARMNRQLEEQFFNSLHRMNIISRTEMLDAMRIASVETLRENSDICEGWQWVSELDTKCCSSCWSMHGMVFPLETVGPEDHQQGRCAGVPITKSWADLGFDLVEPESVLPDAEEVFAALPVDDQLEIMGPARLDALNSGTAQWSDLHTYKDNPDWRGSYVATPVSDLLGASNG